MRARVPKLPLSTHLADIGQGLAKFWLIAVLLHAAAGCASRRTVEESAAPHEPVENATHASTLALSNSTIAEKAGASRELSLPGQGEANTEEARSPPAAPKRGERAAAAPTLVRRAAADFWCFSWLHLRASSVDCFRGARACKEAEHKMATAHRKTRPCRRELEVSCTELDGTERCFESVELCRHFLSRRSGDHAWSPCTKTK